MLKTQLTDKDVAALKRQYLRAKKVYDTTDTVLMSDKEFDRLEDRIRAIDPDWKHLHRTGTRVADKKTEAPLPCFMPSLNKVYPEKVDTYYRSKPMLGVTEQLYLDKLDGTSLQVRYLKRLPAKLFTRGDGTLGGDVSFLLPALIAAKRIPARLPKGTPDDVSFRIEGIMKKSVFEKRWSRAVMGKKGFDNIRNGVNGIFNNSKPHPALADIDMVVLGVFGMELEDGLEAASNWMFDVVRWSKGAKRTAEGLTSLLKHRREESPYEMDGLVMVKPDFYYLYDNADKPKGITAFKVNDDAGAIAVKVIKIIWQKTRLKRWIPKIYIEPVQIDGVMVKHATLHNAAWMQEKGIGVGATIKVLRSGGVIPKVVGVVKKAKFTPPPGPYEVQGRHFVMTAHDAITTVRGIEHFMTSLGVEGLAYKSLVKLHDLAGFKTPHDYMKAMAATKQDGDVRLRRQFYKAGFGVVETKNKIAELRKVLDRKLPLIKLMVASQCFSGSLGERKLRSIEEQGVALKDLLNWNQGEFLEHIAPLHGFKGKTVDALWRGVQSFKPWLREAMKYVGVNAKAAVVQEDAVQGPLTGINIAWTSYRSAEQEALVKRLGGAVGSFSAKTHVLLYDPNGKASTKVTKAGERAMVWSAFVKKYKIENKHGFGEQA